MAMSREQIIKAAQETYELAHLRGAFTRTGLLPAQQADHIDSMLSRMQNPEFSELKLCRWLGWIQGVLYAASNGLISLDEMKEINMRNSN